MAFSSILNDRFPRQAVVWLDHQPRTARLMRSQAAEVETSGDLSVHPVPILVALACCAWFLILSWACFAAFDLETGLAVVVVSTISAMYLGGMTLGGYFSANSRTAGKRRSFRQFLRGRVDIATGFVSGREAMLQIVMLPVGLAVGATAMALIWLSIH